MEIERRRGNMELIDLERKTQEEIGKIQTDVGYVKTDVAVVKTEVSTIKEELKKLVTRPEFRPVQLLTYTVTGSIVTGIVAAWLSQFFAHH